MTTFDHDAPINSRPEADREILARAHNLMLRLETPLEKYIRQRWETAMSATRVALDAWREVWPVEGDHFSELEVEIVREVSEELESAYRDLDRLSATVLGEMMRLAQRGDLSVDQLEEVERAWREVEHG